MRFTFIVSYLTFNLEKKKKTQSTHVYMYTKTFVNFFLLKRNIKKKTKLNKNNELKL